jgi:hypothetical protein
MRHAQEPTIAGPQLRAQPHLAVIMNSAVIMEFVGR